MSTQRLCVVESPDSQATSNILETGSAKNPASDLTCDGGSGCEFAYP